MGEGSIAALELLLSPWIGAADDDLLSAKYAKFDSNDKFELIEAVREDLLPNFSALSASDRDRVISALDDAKVLTDTEIERFWEAKLPPFSLPKNPQCLLAWVREVLVLETR